MTASDGKRWRMTASDGKQCFSTDSQGKLKRSCSQPAEVAFFLEKSSNRRRHGKLCSKVSGKDGDSKSSSSIKKAMPTAMAKFKREQQSTGMIAMTDEE